MKVTLNSLQPEEEAVVISTPEHSLLPSFGVRKGKKIKFQTRQWQGGPLIIEVDGRSVALDRELSAEIIVSRED